MRAVAVLAASAGMQPGPSKALCCGRAPLVGMLLACTPWLTATAAHQGEGCQQGNKHVPKIKCPARACVVSPGLDTGAIKLREHFVKP